MTRAHRDPFGAFGLEELEPRQLLSAVFVDTFDSGGNWNTFPVEDDGQSDNRVIIGGELTTGSGGMRLRDRAIRMSESFELSVDWRTEWLLHAGRAHMALRLDVFNAFGREMALFEARVVSGIDGPQFEWFMRIDGQESTVRFDREDRAGTLFFAFDADSRQARFSTEGFDDPDAIQSVAIPGNLSVMHAISTLYRRGDGSPPATHITSAFDNFRLENGSIRSDSFYRLTSNGGLLQNVDMTAGLLNRTHLVNQPVGDSDEFLFSLFVPQVTTSIPLQIFALELRGPDAEAFTITRQPNSVINPAFTSQFRIGVVADTPGTYRANVFLRTSDADNANFVFRIRVDLIDPLSLEPDLRVFRNEIAIPHDAPLNDLDGRRFGNKIPEGLKTRTFTLFNGATETLTIQSIRVVDPEGHFIVFSRVPESIAPNASATIDIAFVSPILGPHEAFVEILSNDPDTPLYRFMIRGRVQTS